MNHKHGDDESKKMHCIEKKRKGKVYLLYSKVEKSGSQIINMSSNNINAKKNVYVPIGKFDISQEHIHTDALGPCLCVLLHFVFNGQILCFMEHYSFDMDENKMSRKQVLESFLIRICKYLKRKIGSGSIKPNKKCTKLSEARLVIAGGDINEGALVKNAFTLLNNNSSINFLRLKANSDELYLYQLLLNNTIIFKSITRNLFDYEEAIGKFDKLIYKTDIDLFFFTAIETSTRMDFPSLSVHYNCLTKQLTMKIRWSSSSGKFSLASMIINIQSPSTQYYWIINQTKIDQFKLRATLREKERLSEALRLIPANALFIP